MREDLDIPFPNHASAIGGRFGRQAEDSMDPQVKRMAMVAGGLVAGLLLLVGAWSAIGHRSTGIPVVDADPRPVREKPIDQGGTAAIADESIMSGEKEGKAVVAAGPEAPAIAALKATQPAQPPAAAAPQATAPAAQAPATSAQPAPPAAKSAAPATPAQPTPAAGTQTQVQLAALETEQAAMAEWQRLAKKYPDLFANRRPAVSRTEHDGKTFWRLRTGGFADMAAATSFCTQLKAKGGACSLATF